MGGVARFAVSGAVAERWGSHFPWGTLVVNLSGSLVLGLVVALLAGPGAGNPPPPAEIHAQSLSGPWLLIGIGVLGSYTTVSTFSLQTLELIKAGAITSAVGNMAVSLAGCILAAGVGMAAGSIIVSAGG